MRKVLVLEDEENIRSFVVINLKRAGYQTVEAGTGEEALEVLKANPDVKVALLDIMLPGIDGFEVCRRIRATNTKIGIIMLTARSQEMDKVTGLMTGADDYVTKPFKARELVARLKARLRGRSAAPAPSDVLSVSGIELDETNHTAALHGCELSLTPKEFDCLAELLRAGGAPVSSKALFENVWDEEYTSSSHNAVMVYIRRLRKKLAEVDSSEELIETVWGVGYRIPEKRRG